MWKYVKKTYEGLENDQWLYVILNKNGPIRLTNYFNNTSVPKYVIQGRLDDFEEEKGHIQLLTNLIWMTGNIVEGT